MSDKEKIKQEKKELEDGLEKIKDDNDLKKYVRAGVDEKFLKLMRSMMQHEIELKRREIGE